METKKLQLTISLLASNRPDTLPRCLDSLRPIMEEIPSELILIDTSKNPEVHKLLLEYTDQVYEFEWCRDFAKARNEGLSRAKGEWFLYLDDDEWFVETDAIIDFFQSGEYKNYGYANYQVRNFMDVKYTNYSDCWVSRMIRVDEDTHFVSKIHEYFTPLRGARKDLEAMAYHSGYIYETPEKKRAHFERNASLLLDMIKEEPDHIRWQTQLVQEYTSMGEWETLEDYCRERLAAMADVVVEYENIHIATFFAGYAYALIEQKKYQQGIQLCQQAFANKQSTEVLKAMMYLKLGECYFRLGQWDEAIKQIGMYLQMLENIDQSNPKIMEQKLALVVGEAFDDNKQKNAYSILICSRLEKGDISALLKYYDKLGWNQSVIYILDDVEKHLVKAMMTLPYAPIFARIIEEAFQNRALRAHFCRAILEWVAQEMDEQNAFQKILYAYVEALQSILAGPKFWDLISYHNALQHYAEAACQWYEFVQTECQKRETVALPNYIQAAQKINEYIQLESQDKVQALNKLKETVDVYPEFADGIGRFMHSYSDLEKQRIEQQKKEMETLRIQVMSQVKTMLDNGQRDAAIQVVGQLKQMFPEDLEVATLALEVRINS